MNITHYFLEQEFCTQLKNNLQKEAKLYLDSLSKKLIHAEDLNALQLIIKNKIEDLNKKHSRCTPIKIYFDKVLSNDNIRVGGIPGVTFYIKPAQLTHITSLSK